MTTTRSTGGAWRPVAITATGFMAVWAFAGGVGLAGGGLSLGAEIDARLPFGSLPLAGLALVLAVGVPMTWAAVLAWVPSRRAPLAVVLAGAVLVGWIVLETAFIRDVHWLQPLCLVYGLGLCALGRHGMRHRITRSARSR